MAQTPLSHQHMALALIALSRDWEWLNDSLFRSRMRMPQFVLATGTSFMARWRCSTRTMEFADATLRDHPWGVVTEVLKHEMAHQFVDEVLQRTDETAHGPAFREVCDVHNIDARAAGVPEGNRVRSNEETVVMERIRKLLALAESPNEHEAQAAMNAAQRLMLKYNLDAVSQRAARGYGYKHLGTPTGRVDEAQRMLALILMEHFFVETIWVPVWRVHEARTGSVLEVCGTPENLEMAEYVHSFLHHTADALWTLHKRARRIVGDRDRRAYRAGVMAGFFDKLNAERRTNVEKGLVWLGDPELHTYYRQRHPRVTTIRRQSNAGSEAHAHGRAAGQNIVLHKRVEGESTQRGRQLGSGERG